MSKSKIKFQPKSQKSLLNYFSKTPCSQLESKENNKNPLNIVNDDQQNDDKEIFDSKNSPKKTENNDLNLNVSPKKNSFLKSNLRNSPEKCNYLKSIDINAGPNLDTNDLNSPVFSKKIKLSDVEDIPNSPKTKFIRLLETDINKLYSNVDNFDDFDEEFNVNDFYDDDSATESLDLSKWQRCLVIEIKDEKYQLVIKLKSLSDGHLGKCIIRDYWMDTVIEIDDIVSLIAPRESDNQYYITNKGGFLVLHPDNLISGTEIVGSLFCTRRSVLQNYFKGIDSGNKYMVIGILVHELLQNCVKKKLSIYESVSHECKEILDSQQYKYMLFEIGLSENDALSEMTKYFLHISQFVEIYLNPKNTLNVSNNQRNTNQWDGKISDIIDIEENIWSPKYGVSGRIDLTVEVNIHRKGVNNSKKLMPLELKTGKASSSAEHRGQVILYTMLMSEVLKNKDEVNEGLLLYLRDSVNLQEISATYNEKRDLIFLRNKLSHFLEKWRNSHLSKAESLVTSSIYLPPPIDHHSACEKCPYLTLCSLYLSDNCNIELPSNHLLKKLEYDAIGHLTPEDIAYFLNWSRLLLIEDTESVEVMKRKDLWIMSPLAREKRGKCSSNLTLFSVVPYETNFKHLFKKSNTVPFSNNDIHVLLQPGEYVIISADDKYGEASGTIDQIHKDYISVLVNKDLSKRNSSSTLYTIDGLDSKSSSEFNLTNLSILMDNTEASNRLRRIIVNKSHPKIGEKLSSEIVEKGKGILKCMNIVQQRAILQCITTDNYILIKGMPGTGKTQTIVALINLLVKLDMSVLITSHTHSAVDNIFLRLIDSNINMLRLGSSSRIHSKLKQFTESELTNGFSSVEAIKKLLLIKVVGVTCLGSSHPLLTKRTFDVCIVDESTQVIQYSIIRPLLYAKKFILVGDPDQLSPIVRNPKARSLGLEESLFSRLCNSESTVLLTLQYRMNKFIMKLANCLTYDNKLNCVDEKIANATIDIDRKIYESYCVTDVFIKECLSPSLEDSVVIVDTGNTHSLYSSAAVDIIDSSLSSGFNNICETSIVLHIVNALLKMSIEGKQIGIIAPYREQISLLKKVINKNIKKENKLLNRELDIEINTVDQYQGRDKDIIIYSCTRSYPVSKHININDSNGNQILEDKRRLTVAITRAKCKLILIGDVKSLYTFKPFRELFEITTSKKAITKNISIKQLQNENRFSWNYSHCL